MSDPTSVEEKLAYLQRTVDDLSDVVAAQDKALSALQRRVELLMSREAEREAAQSGGAVYADERPPHY